ncbi:hypothetical protein CDV36_016251 [Fusarium kuroshium]|uniref:Uncharacterized protein n=1 Tax=Fusarium kuroshium TaxID=2010991 RepID=A0A3M2QVY4_9HYPO|nr:hypothetical protein CDV36_016251 [Fusarium kuroshium]
MASRQGSWRLKLSLRREYDRRPYQSEDDVPTWLEESFPLGSGETCAYIEGQDWFYWIRYESLDACIAAWNKALVANSGRFTLAQVWTPDGYLERVLLGV